MPPYVVTMSPLMGAAKKLVHIVVNGKVAREHGRLPRGQGKQRREGSTVAGLQRHEHAEQGEVAPLSMSSSEI